MVSPEEKMAYYPPPESKGGWRRLSEPQEVRAKGGIDPDKLEIAWQLNQFFHPNPSAVVVIRHGYLVAEWSTFSVLPHTKFNIWSCTKSFTATAFGILFEDIRQDRIPGTGEVSLDSLACSFVPEGQPLTDALKSKITLRHLFTMTSGIVGENGGIASISIGGTDYGPFEFALGRCPNKYGARVSKLSAEPGSCWDYSDAAFAHLSLIFSNITGGEIADYLEERVLSPIGIEDLSWDVQGGGKFIGPHTNAHTGIHITARDLARFGYLMLQSGAWNGQQLVPTWWLNLCTTTSQEFNETYGYGWWVNNTGRLLPGIPKDAFAARGYNSNRCYVIPSLDLVVTRVGSGPPQWEESTIIEQIVGAIISE